MNQDDLKAKEALYLKAKKAYYAGEDIMSDFEFDELEEELKLLGSDVVEVVGAEDKGEKHFHWTPMLSLGKVQMNSEAKDLSDPATKKFHDQIAEWHKSVGSVWPIEATPKFDGNAISLQYEEGKLVRAISRGDGKKGQDQTDKLKLLVPTTLTSAINSGRIEIRGEVVFPIAIFNAKYASRMKNARNFVAGILGRNEIGEEISEAAYIAYDIRKVKGTDFDLVDKTMDTLEDNGFNQKYPVNRIIINNMSELIDVYKAMKHYRENLAPFLLDGMVLKLPESARKVTGETGHHPKWAIAIKFPPKEAITTIDDIQWSLGNSGAIAPIALLKPVDLDGSMVKRVLLHNIGMMEKLGTYPGATISIVKSGDIIPMVKKVITRSPNEATHKHAIPTECPSCKSKLERNGIHLTCINIDCEGQQVRKLANALHSLEIKGIGIQTVKELHAAGIKNIIDYFDKTKMNRPNLIASGKFKPSKALDIIVNGAEKMQSIELWKVVNFLLPKGIGHTASIQIAKMLSGQPYDFGGMTGLLINPYKDATSPGRQRIETLLQKLAERGIRVDAPVDKVKDANAIGFEMTGSPKDFGFKKKEEFVELMQKHGFYQCDLKEAQMLITDSMTSDSSKMKLANKLGKRIVTYGDIVAEVVGVAKTATTSTTALF